MTRWYELYLLEINKFPDSNLYIAEKVNRKKRFIHLIEQYAMGGTLLEAGCGTGVLSTYLTSLNYSVVGIDIDDDILSLAQQLATRYQSLHKPIFQNHSIFELDRLNQTFNVSFHNGVLEHFTNDEIIQTLIQQLEIAKTVVFGIPTPYFDLEQAMYGNERYLANELWRDLISSSGGDIVAETSFHILPWYKQITDYQKFFRPDPFHVFAVQKKYIKK